MVSYRDFIDWFRKNENDLMQIGTLHVSGAAWTAGYKAAQGQLTEMLELMIDKGMSQGSFEDQDGYDLLNAAKELVAKVKEG